MSRPETAPGAPGYRFAGPPTGLWLGLGVARIATLAGGLVATFAALAGHLPIPLSAAPGLAAVLIATVPVAGVPLIGWVAPVAGAAIDVAGGTRRWRQPVPTAPLDAALPVTRRLHLPPEYGRLAITGIDQDRVGLLVDLRAGSAVVVFKLAGGDELRLLDPAGQQQLLAFWAQALIGFAQTEQVDRLQMVHRSRGPGSSLPRPAGSGSALEESVARFAVGHDSLLAVRLSARTVRRADSQLLTGCCRGLARQLLDAELNVAPLAPAELAATLLGWPAPPDADSVPVAGWASRRSAWRQISLDDELLRGFAVTAWPRLPVRAGWLDPLLLTCPSGVLRTVSLHLRPVPTAAALRRARAARAQADLDAKDRARFGFLTPAAEVDAAGQAADLETELAAGHRAYSLAGLLTLTAGDLASLDSASSELATAAVLAGLQIRPLHGQHADALAASAPACLARLGGAA
ncbi:MAG: SCO6880 family protein [Mycobacteriales bacterium]